MKLGEKLQPMKMGVIRTEKSSAKRQVRASEDNLDRAKEIAEEIQKLVKDYNIQLICAETMSYPRNSSAAAKMANAIMATRPSGPVRNARMGIRTAPRAP